MKMDPIPSMKRRKLVVKSPVTGTPDSVPGIEVSGAGLGVIEGFGDAVGLGVGLDPPNALGEVVGEGVVDGLAVVLAELVDVNSGSDDDP